MGMLDRAIGLAAGIAIVGAGSGPRSRWRAAGPPPIPTAIARRRVLYGIIGISTRGGQG